VEGVEIGGVVGADLDLGVNGLDGVEGVGEVDRVGVVDRVGDVNGVGDDDRVGDVDGVGDVNGVGGIAGGDGGREGGRRWSSTRRSEVSSSNETSSRPDDEGVCREGKWMILRLQLMDRFVSSSHGIPRIMECTPIGATRKNCSRVTPAIVNRRRTRRCECVSIRPSASRTRTGGQGSVGIFNVDTSISWIRFSVAPESTRAAIVVRKETRKRETDSKREENRVIEVFICAMLKPPTSQGLEAPSFPNDRRQREHMG